MIVELTYRQLAVAGLLACGGSGSTISKELHYSREVIKAEFREIRRKTGARTITHAVATLMRDGLL